MRRALRGEGFDFFVKDGKTYVYPVAFGCRRCRGNKSKLHSHLGEGIAGDWAMNRVRHLTFGMRIAWVTDCYAIKFILSYDNKNR